MFNCIDCIIDGFVVDCGGGKGDDCRCGNAFMTIEGEEEIDLLFMLLAPPPITSLMNAFTANDCNDINIANV